MNIQLQFYTLLLGFASCIISNVVLYGLSKNRTVHFKGKKHIDKFSISMRLKSRILINKRQTCIEKIFPPQVNYINMKYTRHISLLAQLYYIYLCVQQPLHFSNEHTLGVASSHYSSMHKNMMYFFDIDIIRFIAAARGRYICIVNYIYIICIYIYIYISYIYIYIYIYIYMA